MNAMDVLSSRIDSKLLIYQTWVQVCKIVYTLDLYWWWVWSGSHKKVTSWSRVHIQGHQQTIPKLLQIHFEVTLHCIYRLYHSASDDMFHNPKVQKRLKKEQALAPNPDILLNKKGCILLEEYKVKFPSRPWPWLHVSDDDGIVWIGWKLFLCRWKIGTVSWLLAQP